MVRTSRKIFTPILLIPMVAILFTMPLAIGYSTPIIGPLILCLGNDQPVKASVIQLEHNIPNAKCLRIFDEVQLEVVVRKTIGEVFYVGHGTEAGLTVGSTLIPWSKVTEKIQSSPSKEHYFAACFSALATPLVEGKLVIGFDTLVDADVAAFVLTTCWSLVHKGEFSITLIENFIKTGGLEKIVTPKNPLYSITWTWSEGKDIGWTPYGLYNPNALHIHYTASDVSLIIFNPLGFIMTLVTALSPYILEWLGLAPAFAGPIGAVLAILIGGFLLSITWINEMDGNADGSIDQYIPVDLINFALGGGSSRWCRTPHWWWLMFATYTVPIYSVPGI
jgi:hypothetical protein